MTDSYRLGIVAALAAIADGRLSGRDYLESCIARTEAVEPRIHAFAHFDPEAVRASAVADLIDAPMQRALTGIPIGLKDIIATKGVPTEMGSAAFVGHVPDRSAYVVDALAKAGAVMFGKTVTTEFAWRQPGATCNPWNLAHTPGGSSSGSAAAVAAGEVPGALGTQTLGSVLRPAAFCGVVGYKPSYSAIPRTGVHALSASLDHIGVFARSVTDAALLASVLVGHDGIDFPGREPLAPAWPLRDLTQSPRIALLRTSVWNRVSVAQQRIVEMVGEVLNAAGATVVPLVLPPAFDAMWSVASMLCDVEGALVNGALAAESPPRISRHTIALVERGKRVSEANHRRAQRSQRLLAEAFTPIAASFDAILMAPALGEAPLGLDDTGDAVLCTPASLLGLPAITIPAGFGPTQLPLGIQLVGAWGTDRTVLEAALWTEGVIGWTPGFPAL